ncbi:hypothetical protein KUCAC02_006731, partial [Chaenocephalus aceratus]
IIRGRCAEWTWSGTHRLHDAFSWGLHRTSPWSVQLGPCIAYLHAAFSWGPASHISMTRSAGALHRISPCSVQLGPCIAYLHDAFSWGPASHLSMQ